MHFVIILRNRMIINFSVFGHEIILEMGNFWYFITFMVLAFIRFYDTLCKVRQLIFFDVFADRTPLAIREIITIQHKMLAFI